MDNLAAAALALAVVLALGAWPAIITSRAGTKTTRRARNPRHHGAPWHADPALRRATALATAGLGLALVVGGILGGIVQAVVV